jgi:hypothetical protein
MDGKHNIVLRRAALMATAAMAYQLACGGKATTVAAHAEASAAGMGSAGMGSAGEAGSCQVLSSQYDQSCTRDSDCLDVGEVMGCPATTCALCETGVISKQAEASYAAAFSAATAGVDVDADGCNCDSAAGAKPCCRMGLCQHCE